MLKLRIKWEEVWILLRKIMILWFLRGEDNSAGTVRPAKFIIQGAAVAGLQAIATAKRLGAIVYASDVRKSAAEQIESVGGRFIEVEGMDDFEDDSGYAKPLTPEFIKKVNDTVCEVASESDIIVTTAPIFYCWIAILIQVRRPSTIS